MRMGGKMRRVILLVIVSLLLLSSPALSVIELDEDSNGAIDISHGGTNATTAAGARSSIGAESATSNDIDPDRLAGDTVDDDKIDNALLPVSPEFDDITTTGDIVVGGDATIAGTITGKATVVNYTTGQNPLAVASKSIITNTGASGTLTHVLPACTGDGTTFTFWLTSTNAIKVEPNGSDRIWRLTDANGDSITSNTTIDTSITLICLENAKWHALEDGTWSDTN